MYLRHPVCRHYEEITVWVCVRSCVCVQLHVTCGLAAFAAWPESRPHASSRWECGEFGWDQLINYCTLAPSHFPCRQGSRDRGGSHTGSQQPAEVWGFFFSHAAAVSVPHTRLLSWPRVKTFSCWLLWCSVVAPVTSFTYLMHTQCQKYVFSYESTFVKWGDFYLGVNIFMYSVIKLL